MKMLHTCIIDTHADLEINQEQIVLQCRSSLSQNTYFMASKVSHQNSYAVNLGNLPNRGVGGLIIV